MDLQEWCKLLADLIQLCYGFEVVYVQCKGAWAKKQGLKPRDSC